MKATLGNGIYTMPETAKILGVSTAKITRWITHYWDGEFASDFKDSYSWSVGNVRAINFQSLVELYVLIQLGEAGVSTSNVVKAHKYLAKTRNCKYPFANQEIINMLKTDGHKMYFMFDGTCIDLDGSNQIKLALIEQFFRDLDFDSERVANRMYPMGRDNSVIIDPHRQFGHPVIGNTNIYPEMIYELYTNGEPKKFLAHVYNISEQEVDDAIAFCSQAA